MSTCGRVHLDMLPVILYTIWLLLWTCTDNRYMYMYVFSATLSHCHCHTGSWLLDFYFTRATSAVYDTEVFESEQRRAPKKVSRSSATYCEVKVKDDSRGGARHQLLDLKLAAVHNHAIYPVILMCDVKAAYVYWSWFWLCFGFAQLLTKGLANGNT